jgi:uncharacterized protein
MLEKFKRFTKARILHVSDSPHKISMGVAMGLFVAWTPTVGIHILLVLALCSLFKANKLAGLASIWVCNPFTFGLVYGPSYLVGSVVVGFWQGSEMLFRPEFDDILHKMGSIGSIFTNFHRAAFWQELFDIFLKIGLELWVGCVIVGIVAAIAGYFASYWFITWYRRRNPRRRFAEFQ